VGADADGAAGPVSGGARAGGGTRVAGPCLPPAAGTPRAAACTRACSSTASSSTRRSSSTATMRPSRSPACCTSSWQGRAARCRRRAPNRVRCCPSVCLGSGAPPPAPLAACAEAPGMTEKLAFACFAHHPGTGISHRAPTLPPQTLPSRCLPLWPLPAFPPKHTHKRAAASTRVHPFLPQWPTWMWAAASRPAAAPAAA
jgi:hypothetical protein